MKIYLTRHGEANSPQIDSKKNLSKAGCKDIEEVAAFLGKNKNTRLIILTFIILNNVANQHICV